MNFEVKAMATYSFEPTEEQEELIRNRAKERHISLSDALWQLYWEGAIQIYDENLSTESDWSTEEICYEGRCSEDYEFAD